MWPFFFEIVFYADGDPQWWEDIRTAVSEESTRNLLETIMEDAEAPSPNDAAPPWPSAKRQKIDCDSELADVLRKTEIMITDFHEQGYLTLPVGQKVLEMLRNPELDMFDTDMKGRFTKKS